MVTKAGNPEIPKSRIFQRSQTPVNLGFVLNKFRIRLSKTEYFVSNFPPVSEDWKKGKTLNEKVGLDIRDFPHEFEKEPYFAMICATYVASFLCGISLKHLSENKNTPKIITSLPRYHALVLSN